MVQLDSLRAIAAVAVLVQHSLPLPGLNLGAAGVKLFFVLSGFLITGILLRERERVAAGRVSRGRALRIFYMRRALRIFPLYYGTIVIAVLLEFPHIHDSLVWHLTYTSNFRIALDPVPFALGHFWSLAVEEQFYLLWPAVVLLAPPRRLRAVLVAMIALGPLSRLAFVQFVGAGPFGTWATTSCLDSLGLGGALAVCSAAQGAPRARDRLATSSLLIGAPVFAALQLGAATGTGYRAGVALGDLALSLVFVWVVARCATGFGGPARAVLEWRPLVYLGVISYGIYVYQGVIPVVVERLGLTTPEYHTAGALLFLSGATVLVATLSWLIFERPLCRMKKYITYN